jgi:hypothetical protein
LLAKDVREKTDKVLHGRIKGRLMERWFKQSLSLLMLAVLALQSLIIAQSPQQGLTAAEKRMRLNQHISHFDKRSNELEELAAKYSLEDLPEAAVWTKLQAGVGASFPDDPASASSGIEEDLRRAFQFISKDAGFYDHPLRFLKHHLIWVTTPQYASKVDWPRLENDVAKWKEYDQQLAGLYKRYFDLMVQIRELKEQLANCTGAACDPLETRLRDAQQKRVALEQQVVEIGKYRGRYGFEVEIPDEPCIVGSIVLEEQTAFINEGLPKYPYPFQQGVKADLNNTRTLFVYGRGLPRNYQEKV